MSDSVTSFWKSMKTFSLTNLFFCVGIGNTNRVSDCTGSWTEGVAGGCPLFPDNLAAEIPACKPSFSDLARSAVPLQPPMVKTFWVASLGIKVASSSFHLTLPPLCEKRCIVGFQPPDIAKQSHPKTFRPPVSVFPSDDNFIIVADLIRL